jgi:hypothetical protein
MVCVRQVGVSVAQWLLPTYLILYLSKIVWMKTLKADMVCARLGFGSGS